MGWEMTIIGLHYPHKNYGESIFFPHLRIDVYRNKKVITAATVPFEASHDSWIKTKDPSQVISTSEHFDTAGFPHLKSLPSSWGASWCEHLNVEAPKPEILLHLQKNSMYEQVSREKKSMRWQRKLWKHTFEVKPLCQFWPNQNNRRRTSVVIILRVLLQSTSPWSSSWIAVTSCHYSPLTSSAPHSGCRQVYNSLLSI